MKNCDDKESKKVAETYQVLDKLTIKRLNNEISHEEYLIKRKRITKSFYQWHKNYLERKFAETAAEPQKD